MKKEVAAVVLVFMSFIFKFLRAHRGVGTSCGYPFPEGQLRSSQTPAPAYGHIPDGDLEDSTVIKRQLLHHYDCRPNISGDDFSWKLFLKPSPPEKWVSFFRLPFFWYLSIFSKKTVKDKGHKVPLRRTTAVFWMGGVDGHSLAHRGED